MIGSHTVCPFLWFYDLLPACKFEAFKLDVCNAAMKLWLTGRSKIHQQHRYISSLCTDFVQRSRNWTTIQFFCFTRSNTQPPDTVCWELAACFISFAFISILKPLFHHIDPNEFSRYKTQKIFSPYHQREIRFSNEKVAGFLWGYKGS